MPGHASVERILARFTGIEVAGLRIAIGLRGVEWRGAFAGPAALVSATAGKGRNHQERQHT
jgi:hypothetical protein